MRVNKALFFIFLIFLVNPSQGQSLTAAAAYDSATHYRDVADSLWDIDKPSAENLEKALAILNRGLDYLNQDDVSDLAQGNKYLKFRRYNILYDIAHIYSLLRQKESTLTVLERMNDVGGYYYDFIEKDTAFDFIRKEDRYQELINANKLSEARWHGTGFKTLYRKDLPLNEKMAGLSLLWSMAKYNFVHFNHANLDWDKEYLDYLNQVSQTKSTAEYYKLLIRFYASLKDAHTNVYFPEELADSFYSRPPFRTELIEGRVFITDIFSDTLKKMGIVKGLEVLSINGEPVLEYAKNNVEPYESSSTPQDRDVRGFTYALLAGSKTEPLILKFRNKDGKEWTQSVPRTGYSTIKSIPSIEYSETGGIGYLQLNSFEDEAVTKIYDSLFSRIAKTKGLIIDLRKNGGGSDGIGFHVLSTLTDTPYAISLSRITQYKSTSDGDGQWYSFPAAKIQPSKKMFYAKPVVLLISARTFSAAEDFVVDFSYMKRGKMIGQTTGGSTGMPLFFNLPGGGTARVCAKDDVFPDGRKFVGTGIAPDIFISKTVDDLYKNNDAVLMKALEILR
jgi:C-terminal processing protease CtpA/Prc